MAAYTLKCTAYTFTKQESEKTSMLLYGHWREACVKLLLHSANLLERRLPYSRLKSCSTVTPTGEVATVQLLATKVMFHRDTC
ncbi:unnamed protein product [Lota lota]